MLVSYPINKAAGLINTRMRGSRQTIPSMAMLQSMSQSQKTEGSAEMEKCTPVGPEEKGAITEFRPTTESNIIITTQNESISLDDLITVKPLLVLRGTFNNFPMKALKDNGCNTNVVSQQLVDRNWNSFRPLRRKCFVQYSRNVSAEASSMVILSGRLQISCHMPNSNWVVANCIYDFLFGMLRHVETSAKID